MAARLADSICEITGSIFNRAPSSVHPQTPMERTTARTRTDRERGKRERERERERGPLFPNEHFSWSWSATKGSRARAERIRFIGREGGSSGGCVKVTSSLHSRSIRADDTLTPRGAHLGQRSVPFQNLKGSKEGDGRKMHCKLCCNSSLLLPHSLFKKERGRIAPLRRQNGTHFWLECATCI